MCFGLHWSDASLVWWNIQLQFVANALIAQRLAIIAVNFIKCTSVQTITKRNCWPSRSRHVRQVLVSGAKCHESNTANDAFEIGTAAAPTNICGKYATIQLICWTRWLIVSVRKVIENGPKHLECILNGFLFNALEEMGIMASGDAIETFQSR